MAGAEVIVAPRFYGDDVLESCLAGHRMFAGSGDPSDSVGLVQQALDDLGFGVAVDGVFGRQTGQAVSAYKAQKGLVPDDPVVGPGTMAALDADFAHELFDLKVVELAGTRFDLGPRTGTRVEIAEAVAICEFESGMCLEAGHVAAYALPPAFYVAWQGAGGVEGTFGLPTGDPVELDESRVYQDFDLVTLILEDAPVEERLGFYPRVDRALVHLPAARSLAASGAESPVAIGYHSRYLEQGLDTADPLNPAEVFAEPYADLFAVSPSPLSIGFSGEKSAGVAAPNMSISGLSRKLGTVSGDLATIVPGSIGTLPQFDVEKYFPESATLLGAIKLSALKPLFDVPALGDPTSDGVPQLKVDTSQAPQIRTFLRWNPQVNNKTVTIGALELAFDAVAGQPGTFSLESQTLSGLGSAEPSAFTSGKLTGFRLTFAPVGEPLVSVFFSELSFRAENGRKPDVSVKLASNPIRLEGQLDFLQTLMDELRGILGGGPSVGIDGNAIKAGYSVAVPTISIGVFSLENIAVSANLIIPLTGSDPTTFDFSFAEKTHPFTLTVELLGGGGFFAIAVDSTDIKAIDLAVEAGANVSFDLAGLASGNAHVMLGIFFHYAKDDTSISGYLRAGAELTVLQLVSLHVEFYAGLTYLPDQHVIFASVSVMVEVAVATLHTSVTLSLERRFHVPGGSDEMSLLVGAVAQRVGVGDVLPRAEDWAQYAEAFA